MLNKKNILIIMLSLMFTQNIYTEYVIENQDTLDILNSMNIEMGFRSSMSVTDIKSPLEIPRDDHSNVFKEMHA